MRFSQSIGVMQRTVKPGNELFATHGLDQVVPMSDGSGYAARMSPQRSNKRQATVPRYIAIAESLRDRILSEQLGPHTLLPSERELAEQHQVSRMTARQALTLLESEGVVYRRPPRGTFVAEPRVRFHIGSFSEEVARLGHRPAATLLWSDCRQPTPSVRLALELDEDATVNVFHRLRTVDDVPFALETTYLPAARTQGILDEPHDGSLWALLRDRYGIELAQSTAVLESIVLDDASSAQLNLRPGSAGTLLTRRTLDTTGQCIEYARDVYRADRTSFEVSETLTPTVISALRTSP
jgi:GntR family transcriptional regulator